MRTTEQMWQICDKLDCFLESIIHVFLFLCCIFSINVKLFSGLPSPTQASFIITRLNSLKLAWHFCVPQKSSTMKHHGIFIHFYFRQDISPFLTQWENRSVRWVQPLTKWCFGFSQVKERGSDVPLRRLFGPFQCCGWRSVTSSTSILSVDPIQCDERQAHAHKDEAQSSEAGSLKHKSSNF